MTPQLNRHFLHSRTQTIFTKIEFFFSGNAMHNDIPIGTQAGCQPASQQLSNSKHSYTDRIEKQTSCHQHTCFTRSKQRDQRQPNDFPLPFLANCCGSITTRCAFSFSLFFYAFHIDSSIIFSSWMENLGISKFTAPNTDYVAQKLLHHVGPNLR